MAISREIRCSSLAAGQPHRAAVQLLSVCWQQESAEGQVTTMSKHFAAGVCLQSPGTYGRFLGGSAEMEAL